MAKNAKLEKIDVWDEAPHRYAKLNGVEYRQ